MEWPYLMPQSCIQSAKSQKTDGREIENIKRKVVICYESVTTDSEATGTEKWIEQKNSSSVCFNGIILPETRRK